MSMRTTRKTVTFAWPFLLSGIAEVQEAGSYIVETHEELLQGMSVLTYGPIETLIFLPARSGDAFVDRVVKIDPSELKAAEKRDASIAALVAGIANHENNPTREHDHEAQPDHPRGAS